MGLIDWLRGQRRATSTPALPPVRARKLPRQVWAQNLTWHQYLAGIMSEMRPPASGLSVGEIDAMRQFPTLADCEQFRCAVLCDTELHATCLRSDVAQAIARELLDRWWPTISLRYREALRYGVAMAQVIYAQQDLEYRVQGPGGAEDHRFGDAYVIDQIRWISGRSIDVELLEDNLGDVVGFARGSDEIVGAAALLIGHGDPDGALRDLESAYLPCYTPWAGQKRAVTHLMMYLTQKGNPPGKAFAPSANEWASQTGQGSADGEDPEDPQDWLASQLVNYWGGGWITLPSQFRELRETGGIEPQRMFDLELLPVPSRAAEFDSAMQALRLLMVEGFFCGMPGYAQAAARQGARNLFTKLKRESLDVAIQLEERLINPYVRLVLGADAPWVNVRPGMVAENRREIMVDLAKAFASARQRLADGRIVSMSSWLDLEATLKAAGAQTRDEDLAALEPGVADMLLEGGRPRENVRPREFDSDEEGEDGDARETE